MKFISFLVSLPFFTMKTFFILLFWAKKLSLYYNISYDTRWKIVAWGPSYCKFNMYQKAWQRNSDHISWYSFIANISDHLPHRRSMQEMVLNIDEKIVYLVFVLCMAWVAWEWSIYLSFRVNTAPICSLPCFHRYGRRYLLLPQVRLYTPNPSSSGYM